MTEQEYNDIVDKAIKRYGKVEVEWGRDESQTELSKIRHTSPVVKNNKQKPSKASLKHKKPYKIK